MNTILIAANILTFFTFIIHTFGGDKELKVNEPADEIDKNFQKRKKWTGWLVLYVCSKTGEKPKWQWGEKDAD